MNLFRLLVHFLVFSLRAACYAHSTRESFKFGREMRKYFFLDQDYVQMNHGAYGIYPKVVYQTLRDFQDRSNLNPALWYKRDVLTELAKIRRILGRFLSADSEDLVIVPNTTTGIATVLRSWLFHKGDRILHFSTIYDSVFGVVRFVVDRHFGAISTVVFNVTYPTTTEEILGRFEIFLDQVHTRTKPITMALIDHVSSMPTVVLPIDRILPMLHKRNIVTVVDAAHAYGQVPINISALNPDFYVTNGHKWGYTARSNSILYVKKKHQRIIHPVTPSRYYTDPTTRFQMEFYWTGTIDFSAYMTFPKALEFRQEVGGEESIRNYIHNLAWEGGNHMAKRLGTRLLQQKNQMGAMSDVQLPVKNPNDPKLTEEWWLDAQMDTPPGTYTPIYKHNGFWWARASAQIYMDITDYEVHVKHLISICDKLNAGQ